MLQLVTYKSILVEVLQEMAVLWKTPEKYS